MDSLSKLKIHVIYLVGVNLYKLEMKSMYIPNFLTKEHTVSPLIQWATDHECVGLLVLLDYQDVPLKMKSCQDLQMASENSRFHISNDFLMLLMFLQWVIEWNDWCSTSFPSPMDSFQVMTLINLCLPLIPNDLKGPVRNWAFWVRECWIK